MQVIIDNMTLFHHLAIKDYGKLFVNTLTFKGTLYIFLYQALESCNTSLFLILCDNMSCNATLYPIILENSSIVGQLRGAQQCKDSCGIQGNSLKCSSMVTWAFQDQEANLPEFGSHQIKHAFFQQLTRGPSYPVKVNC